MKLMVTLDVLNFEALEQFEQEAAKVMNDYNGAIRQAYEIERRQDGTGVEVHIVEFSSNDDFERYKLDPRHEELLALKQKGCSRTDVSVILAEKNYLA
jgi:hypothetical protein